MHIQPISNINFGIYKGTHKTYYGFVDNGVFKDKVIDIYHAFNDNGSLKHKLYYVSNTIGGWIKSKLKFYNNGKVTHIARSMKRGKDI